MVFGNLMMAQNPANEKTSFAVLGGVNYQNFNGKNFIGDKLSSSGIIGFHAGISAMIAIAPEFYFQPGVLFSTKGSKFSEGPVTQTTNLSYIEVPLNLVYKSRLGGGFIYLGFGPYVSYGIIGSTNFKNSSGNVKSDVEFKNKVILSDPTTTAYFKPLDVGGNLLAGYELSNGLFIQLNTQLGMININPEDARLPNDKSSLKNIGFGTSIGYSF